jgi:hypothetical protein
MKKVLVILAVMAFAFAGLTFATTSRINGLGVPTWMTLDDDAIVFGYVGQLNTFKNLALLEMSGPGTGWGGATIDLGGNALGIYVNVPGTVNTNLFNSVISTINTLNTMSLLSTVNIGSSTYKLTDVTVVPDNQITALYDLGLEGMDIGLGLAYSAAGKSYAEKSNYKAQDEISSSAYEIAILLGASLKGDMPIDIGLSVNLPSASYKTSGYRLAGTDSKLQNEDKVDGSGFGIDLGARLVANKDLIANLLVGFGSGSTKVALKKDNNSNDSWSDADDTNGEISGETSNILVNLGVAKLLKANNVNVIAGLTGGYSSLTQKADKITDNNDSTNNKKGTEDTTTNIDVGINVAAETKLNDTWSARAGVSKGLFGITSTTNKNLDTDSKQESSSDSTAAPVISAGISGVISNFTIDAVISQALLFDGPYFIGGVASTGLNTQVSLKYAW